MENNKLNNRSEEWSDVWRSFNVVTIILVAICGFIYIFAPPKGVNSIKECPKVPRSEVFMPIDQYKKKYNVVGYAGEGRCQIDSRREYFSNSLILLLLGGTAVWILIVVFVYFVYLGDRNDKIKEIERKYF